MSDLIDRQAAIDALEKEKPIPFVDKDGSVDPFGAGRQNQWYRDGIAIMNLPSAQPEIIRCKDCKWYGRVDKRRFYRGMDCLQKHIDTIVPDRDFCSKAERKDDE